MRCYPSAGYWLAYHADDGDYGLWMCGGGRTGPDVQIIGWRGEVELTDLTICTDDIGFSDCYLLRPVAPEMVPGIIMAARMGGGGDGWRRVAAHLWEMLDAGEIETRPY